MADDDERRGRVYCSAMGNSRALLKTWLAAYACVAALSTSSRASAEQTVKCDLTKSPKKASVNTARFSVQADGSVIVQPANPNSISFDTEGQLVLARTRAGSRKEVACGSIAKGVAYELGPDADDWSVFDADLYGQLPRDADADLRLRKKTISEDFEKTVDEALADVKKTAKKQAYVKAQTRWSLLRQIEKKLKLDKPADAATSVDSVLADPLFANRPCDRTFAGAARCEAITEIETTLHEVKAALASRAAPAALKVITDKLKPGESPAAPDGFDLCTWERRYQAVRTDTVHLAHIEVPTSGRVFSVWYARGRDEGPALGEREPTGMIVQGVPAGTSLVSQTKIIETKSPADLLGIFIPVAISALKAVPLSDALEIDCASELEPPPLSVTKETRAFVVLPSGTNAADVQVCEGKECSSTGATPSVRNTVHFAAPDRRRFLLALDLGVNAGWTNEGDNAYGVPEYESTVGNDTLTQTFVLRNRTDFRRHVMVSLLFGVRWDEVFVGIGPGLIDFAGQPAVNQWNVRFGSKLAKDVFFTAGIGLRFAERPRDSVPEAVARSRTAEAEAPTPSIAMRTEAALTLGAGIAFDLSLLADGGEKLVGAIRGGKQ